MTFGFISNFGYEKELLVKPDEELFEFNIRPESWLPTLVDAVEGELEISEHFLPVPIILIIGLDVVTLEEYRWAAASI